MDSMNPVGSQTPPAAAHFVSRYLFLTGSWIYTQLINMQHFSPFVLTSTLENEGEFPFEPVYCYQQPFRGNHLWQIASRKILEFIFGTRERYFVDQISKQKTVLLHAHFGTEGYYHLNVRQATGLPLITTFYGADMSALPTTHPKWRKRYRQLFAEGTLFLAEGPHMAQCLVDLDCPPEKVIVQHLGVDVSRIEFIPRKLDDGRPVRILITSSFREKKGIPYGIMAFAKAVQKFPKMELRIVGGAKAENERELMRQCREIVQQEGISEKVIFLGYLPYSEYLQETRQAHLFLAPSVRATNGDTEGGAPVSIIEASAAGMPVIATAHCDIPNVVINNEAGVLVPERDVGALANAILEVASSPEVWPEMGLLGRQRVEKEFDIYKQVARLEMIYHKVL